MTTVLHRTFAFASTLFILVLFSVRITSAQPPPGYHSDVDARSPASLRDTLHQVIDDHIRFPTDGSTDTWDVLDMADEDPDHPGNILDVYKNASYSKAGGENENYEREHLWPSSYGFPRDRMGNYPLTDCHALFLSNQSYNRSRGNNPFRFCHSGCTEKPTEFNHGRGGGSGDYPGNSNWRTGRGPTGTWEAWNGRRGDVARALFYMDVRYEGGFHGVTGHEEPDLILTDEAGLITTSGGENASEAYMGMLSDLLQWHKEDPVDDVERRRNEVVYGFQDNRNPFVDHPEWVTCLYEGICGKTFLFLLDGRFQVQVKWTNASGDRVAGSPIPLASENSGAFWLSKQDHWELLVNMFDGCEVNGHFWVFGANTANLRYTLIIRDTQSGEVKRYSRKRPAGFRDKEAFPCEVDPPVADYSKVWKGFRFQFTDESHDPNGFIVNRLWTFGDGDTSTARNPFHEFPGAADYSLSLTVTDDDGLTATKEEVLEVRCVPRPQCCRVCVAGKACGDACIPRNRTCRQPPGCACNDREVCS